MGAERVTWRVPNLGNGVDAVVVQEWLVAVGDVVAEGDALVTVESDKAEMDLESPVAGTLVAVLAADGDEVAVGAPLAELDPA